MKKLSNTIHIARVRRESPTPKVNQYQPSSNAEEHTNHQPGKEQQLTAQVNRSTSVRDGVHHQKHISEFTSPNNVRLHDTNEINMNKQQYSHKFNSHLSPTPPHSEMQTMDDLCEIPSEAKGLSTKKILVGASVAAVLIAVIIVGIVLAVVLTRRTATTSTTSTTTVSPLVTSAYWSFDNTPNDVDGVYDGQIQNGASYSPAVSTTIPYVGYGRALLLNAAATQFILVSTPFFDLTYTSFTIEAWIYPTLVTSDRGIFGQCLCSTCTNQCLYFILRGGRLYIGFTLNDLSGSTTLTTNVWYHVAFVYNYQTQQQILYVNGIQDAIKSNAAAYQGTNGSIQIGSTQVFPSTNFFNGYIDNLIITTQAKSAAQVLYDASLIVYYSFDLPNPVLDNGPNRLNGTSVNTVTINGRVNQAIRIAGAGCYFQASGFYQVPVGISTNKPFSISMWINPTFVGSSTFVQLFSTVVANCINLLGISSFSGFGGQIFVESSNGGQSLLTGPFVTQNTWTHISLTYSFTNGYTLYFNGIIFGATGQATCNPNGGFATLIIGYSSNCAWSSGASNTAYQGSIDEVYIHNRELTQADVTNLANP